MPPAIRFFALTTRGLEAVSAAEVRALPNVTVVHQGYRHIVGDCCSLPSVLLRLHTIDDVFVNVAAWKGITHTRDILPHIHALSEQFDLRPAARVCASVRPIPHAPTVSVTASFVGHRNYIVSDVKESIATRLTRRRPRRYEAGGRHAGLNLRVFVEHDTAYVGLWLARLPLYERSYCRVHRPGALKPFVAVALLDLADVAFGHCVLALSDTAQGSRKATYDMVCAACA